MPSAKRGAVRNLRSPRLDSILSSLRVLGDDNNLQTYQAPTKKELLEARRETARLRSDMRASISTDATRPLDIKMLLKRFDVYVHNYTSASSRINTYAFAVTENSPHLLRDPCRCS